MSSSETPGVIRLDRFAYRGKQYEVPIFDTADPVVILPRPLARAVPRDLAVVAGFDRVWDLSEFMRPRRPVSLGVLDADELSAFTRPNATRVLDLPIMFPDIREVRVPAALAQFAPAIQRIVDFEHAVHDPIDYFAYLTIDQRWVAPGTLHREAPCHVDGFQGARWSPKCRTNHSYTVSDVLPTAYYPQPFDLAALDERVHDFFWEMNAQVADTDEAYRWQPADAELTVMDCYCVHRGVENDGTDPVFRTWMRVSFEERRRVFDRLGNARNPLFDYDWAMVERDIEALGLVAYRANGDPTHALFPWQGLDGKALPPGAPKTKPRLRRQSA